MTGKERIQAVLRGEIPDMVPIDFGSTRVTGIHAAPYIDLVEYLGLESDGARVYDVPQMLAMPESVVLDYFESDTVLLPHLRPAPSVNLHISTFVRASIGDGFQAWFPGDFAPVREADGSLFLLDAAGNRTNRLTPGGYYFELDILAPGGGYVFSHVHNIQPGIAPEKIITMYEVIKAKRSEFS